MFQFFCFDGREYKQGYEVFGSTASGQQSDLLPMVPVICRVPSWFISFLLKSHLMLLCCIYMYSLPENVVYIWL